MSNPFVTVFRFQRPRFLTAVTTGSDVLTEWLCFLVGETLIDIPGSSIAICYDRDGNDRVKDFEATLDPADQSRSRAIMEEVEKHYDTIWHDDVFKSYNLSDEGFFCYDYSIQPTSITLTLYSSGATNDD